MRSLLLRALNATDLAPWISRLPRSLSPLARDRPDLCLAAAGVRRAAIVRRMGPRRRRVVQAVLYEVGAILFAGPVLAWAFDEPMASSLALAAVLSSIALAWNYVFNGLFERWESRQADRRRTLARRVMHGAGFEFGLVLMLVPVMAWWLHTSWLQAFVANLGLMVFFFVYAVAFTWAFDLVFGPPASARVGQAD